MIEPAPLLIALAVGVALLIGRLLSARASLPVGLFGAVVGALLLQVADHARNLNFNTQHRTAKLL